jgi:hypothetical protein
LALRKKKKKKKKRKERKKALFNLALAKPTLTWCLQTTMATQLRPQDMGSRRQETAQPWHPIAAKIIL